MFEKKLVNAPSPRLRWKHDLNHRTTYNPHNPSPSAVRRHHVRVAPRRRSIGAQLRDDAENKAIFFGVRQQRKAVIGRRALRTGDLPALLDLPATVFSLPLARSNAYEATGIGTRAQRTSCISPCAMAQFLRDQRQFSSTREWPLQRGNLLTFSARYWQAPDAPRETGHSSRRVNTVALPSHAWTKGPCPG